MSFSAALPATLPVWPSTSSTLGELLGFNSGTYSCLGQTKKNQRCKFHASKSNSALVSGLLDQIAKSGSLSAAKSLLSQVLGVVLCRYHKDASPRCLDSWEKQLNPLKTPEIKEEDEENESISGLPFQSPNSPRASQSSPRPPVKIEQGTPKNPVLQHRKSPVSDSSPTESARSKSSKPGLEKPVTQTHKFEPFGQPWSTMALNQAIRKLVQRQLLPREKSSKGCIYIYTFPDNYHDAAPYLKIGNAGALDSRMASWKSQCGYKPEVFGSFTSDLYVKVERLVHAGLHNERMREAGGCPRCGVKHCEWFDVSYSKACGIIGLWTSWVRQEPYDEFGILKKKWSARVERVDLSDSNCWEDFVNGKHDDNGDEAAGEDESDCDEDIEPQLYGNDTSDSSSEYEYDSSSSDDDDNE
ncbi:meiotically up-regulated gene 113-domain-containing protein [Dactylonectria estremocensis]|uniref:Meiotically up-regulated gene 113-domain-containing protein n=1 Tax=Dactylonectria estremocensis TaxID=1079267 RepID=A0A9P9F1V4_9HYPO|nr:meiotically up-regulated gene 113-domain-containing protein [Dactylonectria estremocensis]